MKKFLSLILALMIASNFFCAEVFAASDAEKAQKKDEKLMKKREKQVAKAAKKENFKKVMDLANKGDVYAEIILSYAYRTGQRVEYTSYKDADIWKAKAEKQDVNLTKNFIPSEYGKKKIKLSKMFGLAAYHAHLKNDLNSAIFWAKLGASEKDEFSFAYLGAAYYTGRGVGQDFAMAIDYLKKAGDEPLALQLLSDAYEKGNGVEKDLQKSKIYSDYLEYLKQKKLSEKK